MLEKLKQTILEKNFSGVVTIKQDSTFLFNEAFGYMDRSNELSNNIETSFGIASGTKTFTALGVLKLIESKQLSLDSKIFDYIEKPFNSYDPSVTIHHLLSHTSGLPDYYDEDLIEDFDNFSIDKPWHTLLKPSDYFSSMPDREMKFKPGSEFNYNNGGYVLLAMLIEKLTGNYHTWIHNEVIEPLKLSNTGFYRLDQLPKNTAIGYIDVDGSWITNVYKLPIIGGGDGGIFTCSDDLLKLWHGLYNHTILSKELSEKMLTPQAENASKDAYGYGIWLYKDDNTYTPSMVGSDAGVSFMSYYSLEKNIIVNVISNTSEGTWDILKVVDEVIKKTASQL